MNDKNYEKLIKLSLDLGLMEGALVEALERLREARATIRELILKRKE